MRLDNRCVGRVANDQLTNWVKLTAPECWMNVLTVLHDFPLIYWLYSAIFILYYGNPVLDQYLQITGQADLQMIFESKKHFKMVFAKVCETYCTRVLNYKHLKNFLLPCRIAIFQKPKSKKTPPTLTDNLPWESVLLILKHCVTKRFGCTVIVQNLSKCKGSRNSDQLKDDMEKRLTVQIYIVLIF